MLILYSTDDDKKKIQLGAKDRTVWLSGCETALILDVTVQNIGLHLKNLYEDEEIRREATTEESSVVKIHHSAPSQRGLRHG